MQVHATVSFQTSWHCLWNFYDTFSLNFSGAAVGGHGMSDDDRKVCMVDDMEGLSPLAEAYARARGRLLHYVV